MSGTMNDTSIYSLNGRVAVLTGGGGILAGFMGEFLAEHGARVVVADLNVKAAEAVAARIKEKGGIAAAIQVNVLDKSSIENAVESILGQFETIDILVNGAGGNKKEATTSSELSFFDISADVLKFVFDLNLIGTILPSQVVGKYFAKRGDGVIVNISSMNSFRPLTRIAGYSAAKAAVNNFTQWLAVHLAQNYSKSIRVNAIAPGFFETNQNKFLLREEKTGKLTARGQQIIDHTPMGRFGVPGDLAGTLLWLVSPASKFVTGIVVPVDGGFSAFSGV